MMLRFTITAIMVLTTLSCASTTESKSLPPPIVPQTTSSIPQVELPPKPPRVIIDSPSVKLKAVERYITELLSYKDKVQYHVDYLSRLQGIYVPAAKPITCTNLILGELIEIPTLPNVGHLSDAQVLDALIRHIDDLRQTVSRHNDRTSRQNLTISKLCG